MYVDLGSMSEFDKVVLHWINKAVKGKVQVSDDAVQWKDAAELPGGDGLIDEIALNGKQNARYVRVLMQEPANGSRYILSEVEVMGKGGLVAQPVASPPASQGKTSLSGGTWPSATISTGGSSVTIREMRRSATSGVDSFR